MAILLVSTYYVYLIRFIIPQYEGHDIAHQTVWLEDRKSRSSRFTSNCHSTSQQTDRSIVFLLTLQDHYLIFRGSCYFPILTRLFPVSEDINEKKLIYLQINLPSVTRSNVVKQGSFPFVGKVDLDLYLTWLLVINKIGFTKENSCFSSQWGCFADDHYAWHGLIISYTDTNYLSMENNDLNP